MKAPAKSVAQRPLQSRRNAGVPKSFSWSVRHVATKAGARRSSGCASSGGCD